MNEQSTLLDVRNLTTEFRMRRGSVTAVDAVSFKLSSGQTLGLVGESGAGKSTVAYSITGLIDRPGIITDGEVLFQGQDLRRLDEKQINEIRGDRICMIFQDPMSTLNPVYRVGQQLAEGLIRHRGHSREHARKLAETALRDVGIPSPELRARSYPHQLSGGMQQRIIIAAALALQPDLLIADEPTTALDPTIQSQIIDLMSELIDGHGMSLIIVTHNLAILAEIADRIAVMYAGSIVEIGGKNDLLDHPAHPYTKGLLDSIPSMKGPRKRLYQIPGVMPSLGSLPQGCKYQARRPVAGPACSDRPALRQIAPGRSVACHFPLT